MDITQDNQIHLHRFKYKPPHPSYIAGFIDGDGCLFIRKIKDWYQSGIQITQSRSNILQIMKYHFGGSITSSTNRNKPIETKNEDDKNNKRNQYSFIVRSNEYSLLLNYIQNCIIIKHKQFDALYEFSKLINQQGLSDKKEELYKICLQKKDIESYKFERLNIEYIQGLFDAEGCIFINKDKFTKYRISITQKSNPDILQEIQHLLGFGIINSEKRFVIYKKSDCLQFLQLVKPFVIVKYNQVVAFEKFLQTDDHKIKEEMYKICNREKHQIEHFTDLNQSKEGKDGYLESLRLREIKEKVCKEIQLAKVYKDKSEKMSGEGNHNYGKTFSKETKKKMSISIREAKGGVSDEQIKKVRILISEGKQNIEIQDLLGVPLHSITRIKNGSIVCSDEDKKEKKHITQEELNINKRKIQVCEILKVVELSVEGQQPIKILKCLVDEREKNNLENNLTVDIIKNIRRSISSNKMPIYESELSPEQYQYYKNMIDEKYAVKE
uniref:Homing endonuclease LAGLIDADG domain-containing protein n=1 Tax=viral metagenome TaxID=1070528 RepID=A0A6C0KU83_9ZZZZ